MMTELLHRKDVPQHLTWNLKDIFPTEEDFNRAVKEAESLTKDFVTKYEGKIKTHKDVLQGIEDYNRLLMKLSYIGDYAYLDFSVDMTDSKRNTRMGKTNLFLSRISQELSFFESELLALPDEILKKAAEETTDYQLFIENLLERKPHMLSPETEKVMASLEVHLDRYYEIYEQALHADLSYGPLKLKSRELPMSFVKFENEYQISTDTEVRRKAFDAFSKNLRKYENTVATAYNAQVQKEKALADLRGFNSVIDYLLFEQKVTAEMYHRQIDVIMEELAPIMRRYAKIVQQRYGLEEMTFADLKAPLDGDFSPKVSVEDSQEYVEGALSVMGEEYMSHVRPYLKERWVDFAQNIGKSSGGFCASPYQIHPYILLSWTGELSELFTLVHELGHGAHFALAQKNQKFLSQDLSMYLVEAPSTCNETLFANYLMAKNDDPRFRRWVLSSVIENTYYHNFVTHLLEAHFQREVYRLVDQGEIMDAQRLNALKRATLQQFWGDAVAINDGAELTWMRQGHYYMGLYSYTYSAGLTLSTVVGQAILKEGQPAVDRWLKFLKAGGTLKPLEHAQLAGVDLSTDGPLKETIAYIGNMVDKVEQLTKELA